MANSDAINPISQTFYGPGPAGLAVSDVNDGTNFVGNSARLSFVGAIVSKDTDGQAVITITGGFGGGTLVTRGITGNSALGSLPTNGFIIYLFLRETAGEEVSITIGSTSGGSDVLSTETVLPNGTLYVDVTAFSVNWFSDSSPQELYISSASWNSAALNALLAYGGGV